MPGEVMAESLRRYFDFLSSCLDKGYKIALVTVPLPAVRDGPSCLEMQALRPGLDVSQQERTSMTLEYNLRIRQWAFQNDVFLVDLDAELLDPSSGLLREEFYKRDKVDNHLDPSAFSSLLCRKLGGHEFEGWVSRNACRAPG